MINLDNIYSLTEFKRNVKQFLERIKATKSPLVLTVNGKAEVVVYDASAFQEMIDKLERTEEELRKLKFEALKRDIAIGAEQLKNGEYKEYDDESLSNKVEESNPWVKFAGIFKDDPLFDEFVEDMATYRRELDAQLAADEMNSEERRSA